MRLLTEEQLKQQRKYEEEVRTMMDFLFPNVEIPIVSADELAMETKKLSDLDDDREIKKLPKQAIKLSEVEPKFKSDLGEEFGIDNIFLNEEKGATVIKWEDGTITKVQTQNGETFDFEKGIALCFMKKLMGNSGRYNEIFHKYAPVDDLEF